MSKNNTQEYVRKMEQQRQRFGLRKLSIGVASVLLGTTFIIGGGTVAHADSTSTPTVAASSTTSEESQSASQQAANEVNEKATTSESVSTNAVSQNDSQSKVALSSQTSGSQAEANTGGNSNTNQAVAKSSEIQTLNSTIATATPLSAKALTESKVQAQGQISITVNLRDTEDSNNIVKTITYTGKQGDTLKQVTQEVQSQIDADNANYTESPLVTNPAATNAFDPDWSYESITDQKVKNDYDAWVADKRKNIPLAGYVIDNSALTDTTLVNGNSYDINLTHERRTYNEPAYVRTTRTIHYVKYGLTGEDGIASQDVIQDGTSNIIHSSNSVVKEYNKEVDGHNQIAYETITRDYDVATGLIVGPNDQLGNVRSYVIFDEQANPVIDNWMTPDSDVTATVTPGIDLTTPYPKQSQLSSFPNNNFYDYLNHKLWRGYYDENGKVHHESLPGKEALPITITYYHNQPVDLSFEDISKIDPQDLSGNNYSATNELTIKNDDSNQYNVYDASNGTKTLSQVISDIEAKGYKLVSITNDDDSSQNDLKGDSSIDLTYNKDGVWKSATGGDNADNLIHKRYTIKFEHNIVSNQTIKTSTTRTVHYVADDGQYSVLKDPETQTVNFTTTGDIDLATNSYVDPTTNADIKVTKNDDGSYTMNLDDAAKVSGWKTTGSDSFDKVQKDKFNNDGLIKGVWNIEYASDSSADGAKLADKFAPEVANVSAKKYNDIYLVYNKATAGYNIHYIDVSDSNKASNFAPNDGNELPHEIKDIHGDIGDKSNATKDLWTTYGDDGYVAVGLSDNAQDGKLATQEFAEGMQDQYVYLKHKAVEITSKTPNPPENSSVDPKDLTKSADRIIHYVTEKDKTPLLDDTPQKITFEGTAYIDMVNGRNVQTTEGTDALTGQKVLIALTKPGTITWTATADDGSTVDNNKGSFNQVIKPVITITDGKLAGTWTVTGATANNAKQDGTDLDPASKDFDPHREVTLEYTKDVNADIIYIDDTDNKVLIPTAQDTDEHGKPGQDVHFAQDPQKTIANFEDQGYVLVRDDFGKGQKYGETDSHYEIHFVHGVNKTVEHKSAVRIIHYVTDDGDQVLLDPTTQDQVSFTKTTYTDKITHKTVSVKEVRDSEGNTVEASDNIETTPSWVVDGKDSFDQVTKPVITDGKLAGKWLVTEATANNAPKFTVPDPSDPSFKEVYDVTLKYVQNVDADITYWDITYGMNHKSQLGNTDPASDSEGRTGELIHFNNNEKRISNLESQNYVFVDTDYHPTDKYGKETSHFNVYFRHAVKDITPNTPVNDVPKDPDGKPVVDPKSLHKEFTRDITFVANNDAKSPLKDSIPQKVTFDGHVYVDMVTGQTTTPETAKDAKGNNVQVATSKDGDIEWNHDTQDMAGVIQKYITLNKGDKYATSDDMVGTWHWISGDANEITLTPTSHNPEDCVLVYEKNKSESGPRTDYDLATTRIDTETKTFTRDVIYRGTKDGGVHFEKVNGSPDSTNKYVQKTTFTRRIIKLLDKDGNVVKVLGTTPWTSENDTFGEVISKTPSEVGYDEVDIKAVNARTIDPDKDPENLGETIVTYSMKPKHETGPSTDHDLPTVDIKQEAKTFTRTIVYRGTKDDGVHYESVNGSPDGKNTYKQTVTFTRNVFSTTAKDGKVTILEIDPWTAKDDTLSEVISKTPGEVGYDEVDIKAVNARTIDPDRDNPDLGTITVTYRATPAQPTSQPTEQPTAQPTVQPTEQPTSQPSEQPTSQPTVQPTAQPTEQPTSQPTEQPTAQPTEQPTTQPTVQPTEQPTSQPTVQPSEQPTVQPSEQPTSQPTAQPTEQPTSQPTVQPSEQPTSQPTVQPTEQPTVQPSEQPTSQPSEQPAIETNTQLPGELKNEEPQPMTTQVTTKKGEISIVEPTNSSSQPTPKQGAQQLPQTGNQKSSSLIGLGFAGLLSALGLTKVNKKRKD